MFVSLRVLGQLDFCPDVDCLDRLGLTRGYFVDREREWPTRHPIPYVFSNPDPAHRTFPLFWRQLSGLSASETTSRRLSHHRD